MALPRKKPATYEDVLAAPEHLVAETRCRAPWLVDLPPPFDALTLALAPLGAR